MSDLNFQNLSTVQSNLQPNPPTIASSTVIAPTTFLTFVTGTVAITTITPPVTGAHALVLVFTSSYAAALTASTVAGGIKVTTTATANVPVFAVYDPSTALYWCGTLKSL